MRGGYASFLISNFFKKIGDIWNWARRIALTPIPKPDAHPRR